MANGGWQAINNAGHNTGNHISQRRSDAAINHGSHLNTHRLAKPDPRQVGRCANGGYRKRQFFFAPAQFQIFLDITRRVIARNQQSGGVRDSSAICAKSAIGS